MLYGQKKDRFRVQYSMHTVLDRNNHPDKLINIEERLMTLTGDYGSEEYNDLRTDIFQIMTYNVSKVRFLCCKKAFTKKFKGFNYEEGSQFERKIRDVIVSIFTIYILFASIRILFFHVADIESSQRLGTQDYFTSAEFYLELVMIVLAIVTIYFLAVYSRFV
jgi:hypothetical protein